MATPLPPLSTMFSIRMLVELALMAGPVISDPRTEALLIYLPMLSSPLLTSQLRKVMQFEFNVFAPSVFLVPAELFDLIET
jgi:hypothetical protein